MAQLHQDGKEKRDKIIVNVKIPANTTATIILPAVDASESY